MIIQENDENEEVEEDGDAQYFRRLPRFLCLPRLLGGWWRSRFSAIIKRIPMTEPQTNITAESVGKTGLWRIVDSLGVPLFLFSVSLMVLLLISWAFVLPHFTRFTVDGKELSASALIDERKVLEKEVHAAEEKRDQLLLPVHDETYNALKQMRAGRIAPLDIRRTILLVASQSAGREDVIVVHLLKVDEAAGTVKLEGDVRNSGPRSMTVLAEFVESLRAVPFVASLKAPAYMREEKSPGEFHSPFTIELIINSSDSAS